MGMQWEAEMGHYEEAPEGKAEKGRAGACRKRPVAGRTGPGGQGS